MNILLLNVNIGKGWGWGGIESHSDTLAALLAHKGHRVIMGCWKEGSVAVSGGCILPSARITIRNSGDITAIAKIIRISLKERIQVIIANNGREYWPATVAALLLRVRVIFVRHQTDRLKKTTCWLVNRFVDKVIAVSEAVRDALMGSGISARKIEVVHNSVSLDRFNPAIIERQSVRDELSVASDDILVGTAGKLTPGKGVFDFLSAVDLLKEQYPKIKLIFVGDGPERTELERKATQLSMHGKVIFTGVRKDMERMYGAMDIFVLPSTCTEAFGMVLIEAMAMNRPVIATEVGGIPEIIDNSVTGLIVPPQDPVRLARAIAQLVKDNGLSQKMASAGRRMVEEKFSDKAMGEQFQRILNEIL